MKTFVTDWANKSSSRGRLSTFKHWLFVRREAVRYALAPFAVAIAFLARLALTPILGDASPYLLFVPAVLIARRPWRARTGSTGNRPQCRARPFRDHDFSEPLGAGNRRCRFIHADRSGHLLERRTIAAQPHSSRHQHAGGSGARGSSRIDPGNRAGWDDRHRPGRNRALVQHGSRAAVRL